MSWDLNSSHEIPLIGRNLIDFLLIDSRLFLFGLVGTYKSTPTQLEVAIPEAIRLGYRLFGKFNHYYTHRCIIML